MFGTPIRAAAREAIRFLVERLGRSRPVVVPIGRDAPPMPGPEQGLVPELRPGLRPMPPLKPPAALNDNPLAAIEAEVERELRAKGYLR